MYRMYNRANIILLTVLRYCHDIIVRDSHLIVCWYFVSVLFVLELNG